MLLPFSHSQDAENWLSGTERPFLRRQRADGQGFLRHPNVPAKVQAERKDSLAEGTAVSV